MLFYSGSSKYTSSNLKAALALQGSMAADMGGTEIYQPLKHILGKSVIKGHPRQVGVHILYNLLQVNRL